MIIIKLQAGLGNQMFQYAFGRSLEEKLSKTEIGSDTNSGVKNTKKIEIKFDNHYYLNKELADKDTPREYLLDKFNTKINLATLEECLKLNPIIKKYFVKCKNKILRAFAKKNPYLFSPSEFNVRDNSYLIGYWQSEKYFKEISDDLRKEFTLKKPFSNESLKVLEKLELLKKSGKNVVSMHIRRGDYITMSVNFNFFGTLSLDYYKKAIEYIKNKVTTPHFFIFSDDIEWVKKNFEFLSPENTEYISNPKIPSYEEIILMSKCDHHIIANSSFSWWGAWLNPSENKIVIAPEKWLSKNSVDTSDVIPPEWIKLT